MPGDVVANPGSRDPGDVVNDNNNHDSENAVVIVIDNVDSTLNTSEATCDVDGALNTSSIEVTLCDDVTLCDGEVAGIVNEGIDLDISCIPGDCKNSERDVPDVPDIPCPSYEVACRDEGFQVYPDTHSKNKYKVCIENPLLSSLNEETSLKEVDHIDKNKNYVDDQLPCSSHEATTSSYKASVSEDEDRTYIDSELPCSSRSDVTRRNSDDTSTSGSDDCNVVTKKEKNRNIHLDDLTNNNKRLGTTNLAYSSDSIDSLPVLLNLNDNCSFRYSVVLDSYGNNTISGLDFSEALAGPSTSNSSLDFNLRNIPLERTCSCNCHSRKDSAPSYDALFSDNNNKKTKTDSLKIKVDHDDEKCLGMSCPMYHLKYHSSKRHHHENNNTIINFGNSNNMSGSCSLRNSPNITPGNTPGRFRRILPAQMVKMLNSRGSSPVSDKAPPNYRSLIFSILQDEPPKYEDVTGKKLADELIGQQQQQAEQNNRQGVTFGQRMVRLALKRRFIGIVIFLVVIALTIIFLYLSAAISGDHQELADG